MRKVIYLIIATILLGCSSQEKNLPDNFDFGKTNNGTYRNNYFNMEISFDPDWSVQNKQQVNDLMEKGTELVGGEDNNLKSAVKAAQVNTAYLLTIFKHEVGSAVEFNPAFMAVAENTKNAPGIKNGKDYLFHARKLLEQTQLQYYFDREVYTKTIGKSTFYVLEAKFDIMGKTLTQEYFTTVTKGFSLSFIVSYSTEEEKAELYRILEKVKM